MTIDYDRLRALADKASPGPWTVDIDEGWGTVIVANESGHELSWGDQVRFEMEAGQSKVDPHLVALAPELARELLRLRDEIKRTRDRVADELEHIPEELHCARITLYTERDHFLAFCNDLLNGDTE